MWPRARLPDGLRLAGPLLAAVLALSACAGMPPATWLPAADFSALVKTYGPAVVNIGVVRGTAPRPAMVDGRRAAPGRDQVDERSLGSGFIVSGDGYILTNAHVVAQGRDISVRLADRREFKARLVGLDPVADVALLKIEAAGLPVVATGDPERSEVGDWVVAIGAPYGFSQSATAGIISAKGRVLPGADYLSFLQTDVPINPGNSGGPLFNLRGQVIGINSRIYSNSGGYQGLSFAIPIDVAMRIKEQLQAGSSVTRGRIGVAVQEVSQALAHSFRLDRPAGALISYVEPGGAADRAGLRPGDVILDVAGREVRQSADALIFVAELRPGEVAPMTVWRDRQRMTVEVSIDRFETPSRPALAAPDPAMPLGMVVRPLLPQELQVLRAEAGLLVQRVNAAASRAGMEVGDVILAVNGQPVGALAALAEAVTEADGSAALLVQRRGARIFVALELPGGAPR